MIHKIIDQAVPNYIAKVYLKQIMESLHWRINRGSNGFNITEYLNDPTREWEKPQPCIDVMRGDHIQDEALYGYSRCVFDLICHENNVKVSHLNRILVNANYKDVPLTPHIDKDKSNWQSMVLFLTPYMKNTGLQVGKKTIPYEFGRCVWFDSKDLHTATPLVEDHVLPRITVAFMFEV